MMKTEKKIQKTKKKKTTAINKSIKLYINIIIGLILYYHCYHFLNKFKIINIRQTNNV